jgi:hypothetical protein
MTEPLYGVTFDGRQNYNGRDENGLIKMTRFGLDGRLMTKDCAEQLCKVLQIKYPQARVIDLLRNDRDEITAESLADLGEQTPIQQLQQLVREAVRFGNTREQIITAVESSIFQTANSEGRKAA